MDSAAKQNWKCMFTKILGKVSEDYKTLENTFDKDRERLFFWKFLLSI